MTRLAVSVHATGNELVDLHIDVDPQSTIGALCDSVRNALGTAPAGGLWVGDRLLDDSTIVAASGLRHGDVLSFGRATATAAMDSADDGWQLHVIGGPDSGTVFPLPIGTHTIGRTGTVQLNDPSASRAHAVLRVGTDSASIVDTESANGTLVNGKEAPQQKADPSGVSVQFGDVLHLGDSLLGIQPARHERAVTTEPHDGIVELVRPPRIVAALRSTRISLPQPPADAPARKIPVIAMLAPALMGIVMALVMGQPAYLIFALGSPVMAGANYVSQRRQGSQDARRHQADYEEASERVRADLQAAVVAETAQRRDLHPDPARTRLIVTRPESRLWERRPTDDDFLALRLGSAHLAAEFEVIDEHRQSTHPTLQDVPAVVSLGEAGVLGIAGDPSTISAVLRWQVSQLATRHSPRDVRLVVLTDGLAPDLSWVSWLPHVRGGQDHEPIAYVGNDDESILARIGELTQLLESRTSVANAGARGGRPLPAYVVVLDGANKLRGTPGVQRILADGPAVGIHALCFERHRRLLPTECKAVLTVDADETARATLRSADAEPIEKILIDQVSAAYATEVARALAPTRDGGQDGGGAALPDSARLLELLGMDPPTATAIQAGWAMGGSTTSFVAGAGVGGTFRLDLRSDGPHALVAGTTGSGKSELLQTIVASLAVANRPDAINFVLVDYKGGSAFKDCVDLPHTVGMVTDLDAHLVQRALASLQAELQHREHQLAGVGAKNIEDYTELRDRDGNCAPLPRLVIVIDEFASLVRELPDFVKGLVNIAQRGRSLGIHLILATQRPSGAVSPEIRANTNLRISLRVLDAADSTDVLESPDAARISATTPGRGLARLGHAALAPFQSGRVGGRRPGAKRIDVPLPFVALMGWGQVGYCAPRPESTETRGAVDVTDLSDLVAAIKGANHEAGFGEQRRPWLDALPPGVLLDSVPRLEGLDLPPIVFGLTDVPCAQQQRPAAFDLATQGHQYVVGGPRSGRSQFLRTLAGAAVESISCADLHLYGLDCGSGALLALTALPHTGAIVTRTESERATRLLARLTSEMHRRQGILSVGHYADITEQRSATTGATRLPHLMLLLDRWEAFAGGLGEMDNGRISDQIVVLLREGASVGIHVVITGDRTLVSARMSTLCEHKLALRLSDRNDYLLAGVPARSVPDDPPPGRGYSGDDAVETQIAVLAADSSGAAQAAAIETLAARVRLRDADVPSALRPFRLDALPTAVDYDDVAARVDRFPSRMSALVALGGDELAPCLIDLADRAPAFVVGGPRKSGRSTALLVIVRSLLAAGSQVVIGAPRTTPLSSLAGQPGVLGVLGSSAGADDWRQVIEAVPPGQPVVVVLDDAEHLQDSPAKAIFAALARGVTGPDLAIVAGGNTDGLRAGISGWLADVRRAKQGLLLSPQDAGDGDLIGVRLPRGSAGGSVQPGRGLLHMGDNQPTTVQVPMLNPAVLEPT